MLLKLFGAVVVTGGLALAGLTWGGAKTSCCYPGSPCCYPGSPCCEDCCAAGADCCTPAQECCGL